MSVLAPNIGHAAVASTVLYSAIVHHGVMAVGVMKARKQYGVKYPDLYANKDNCEKEEYIKAFNCVQRGHQNSLENLPTFYALLGTGALFYPLVAAVFGLIYVTGRLAYFMGYSTGSPDNRLKGAFMYIGLLGLMGTLGKVAVDGIMAFMA